MKNLTFKEQCIALRKQDKTLDEIVSATGRSKTTVYFHIKNIPLSEKKQREISENSRKRALSVAASRRGKSLRPFKTFSTWNPKLVLLVSHLLFDGEIKKKRCVYSNRSEALIERVQHLMRLLYDYPGHITINSKTGVITVAYYNVALSNFLQQKSEEMLTCIHTYTKVLKREFLRAFFDDEACMDYSNKTRRVRGYQKDRTILLLVQTLLKTFNIESSIREPNEIVISGKTNLEIFQREINFSAGVRINPNRTNSRWKKNLEKRALLQMAIDSYQS